ncbi:MAG TPA: polysaccharide deacetylase family protein [Streptosporangiaceae bacterium]|jgi:peptidoglycan/xylan/chitin deacetylase (PgdA/CDA1 family)
MKGRVIAVVFAIGVVVIALRGASDGRASPASASPSPSAAPQVPKVAAPPAARPRLTGNPPIVDHIPTKKPVVFLTIDDGWTQDPAFPALLRRLRVPVTLFLTDKAIAGKYAYFRQLRDAGAVIEDHTLTHHRLTTLDAAGQRREICGAADTYEKRFGRRPTLFRPPGGRYDAATLAEARGCGIKGIVLWRDSVQLKGRIAYQEGRLRPGDVILMHFRPGLAHDFPIVLSRIRHQGLELGRLTDYVG